jgi:biopolymer transport protein ExbB
MTGFRDSGGMIQAFIRWLLLVGRSCALSEGIYTAMTTTVVGLVVGIIAYVGYIIW